MIEIRTKIIVGEKLFEISLFIAEGKCNWIDLELNSRGFQLIAGKQVFWERYWVHILWRFRKKQT